jgi:hypothetical protein
MNTISGKTILTNWAAERANIDLTDRAVLETLMKAVEEECDKHELLPAGYGPNLDAFCRDLCDDQKTRLWQLLAKAGGARVEFIKSVYPFVAPNIHSVFRRDIHRSLCNKP